MHPCRQGCCWLHPEDGDVAKSRRRNQGKKHVEQRAGEHPARSAAAESHIAGRCADVPKSLRRRVEFKVKGMCNREQESIMPDLLRQKVI